MREMTTIDFQASNLHEAVVWCSTFLGVDPDRIHSDQERRPLPLRRNDRDQESPGWSTPAASDIAWWYVDDLDEALARARYLGAVIHRSPADRDTAPDAVAVVDPDGNVLGVLHDERSAAALTQAA